MEMKEYAHMKAAPGYEKYADGTVGASVRIMVRGGCLPMITNPSMNWKYEGNDTCTSGELETKDMFCFNVRDSSGQVNGKKRWEMKVK